MFLLHGEKLKNINYKNAMGLLWWLSGKESAYHCRRHGFNPSFGNVPQAMEQLSPCATMTKPVL